MYDFVTVILGILLVQLFLILFGVHLCIYLEHITGELPDTKVSTNIVLKHIHNTFFKKSFYRLLLYLYKRRIFWG